jgi:hypothetical protein
MSYNVKIQRSEKPDVCYELPESKTRFYVLMDCINKLEQTLEEDEPLNFTVSVTHKAEIVA